MAPSSEVDVPPESLLVDMFLRVLHPAAVYVVLRADVIEPPFLIGGSTLIVVVGAFICGFSRMFAAGCIGRLFVGIGCGPVFVPCCLFVAKYP
jgi:hypothetical protein